METWIQRLGSGRNVKLFYFAQTYLRRLTPRRWLIARRHSILKHLKERPDFPQLKKRIDYYCRCDRINLGDDAILLKELPRATYCAKVYSLDSNEIRRYFSGSLRWEFTPGDNVVCHDTPTIVKSRPIGSANDVLLKLNRVRHFIFLRDRVGWDDKIPMAIFRGRIGKQPRRLEFVRRFSDSLLVDSASIDSPEGVRPEWVRPKISLYDHFRYRYIVCLEGNDVASNLKWAMHSSSVVIMPRPRFETWYMEGRLQPGVHYIEIRDDYSDLEEKVDYYNRHQDEARKISANARKWAGQFTDSRLERQLGVAVMHNYLVRTGQLDEPEV